MRDLASPVAAFVREQCETGAGSRGGGRRHLYGLPNWCDDNGHTKPTKQTFGRNLRAAFPQVRIKRPREGDWRVKDERVSTYEGVALRQDR